MAHHPQQKFRMGGKKPVLKRRACADIFLNIYKGYYKGQPGGRGRSIQRSPPQDHANTTTLPPGPREYHDQIAGIPRRRPPLCWNVPRNYFAINSATTAKLCLWLKSFGIILIRGTFVSHQILPVFPETFADLWGGLGNFRAGEPLDHSWKPQWKKFPGSRWGTSGEVWGTSGEVRRNSGMSGDFPKAQGSLTPSQRKWEKDLQGLKAWLGSQSSAEPLGFYVRVLQQAYYAKGSTEPSCTTPKVLQNSLGGFGPPSPTSKVMDFLLNLYLKGLK